MSYWKLVRLDYGMYLAIPKMILVCYAQGFDYILVVFLGLELEH